MAQRDTTNQLIYQRETLKRQLGDTADALMYAYSRISELEALLKPIVDECDEMGPETCLNPTHAAARKALGRTWPICPGV